MNKKGCWAVCHIIQPGSSPPHQDHRRLSSLRGPSFHSFSTSYLILDHLLDSTKRLIHLANRTDGASTARIKRSLAQIKTMVLKKNETAYHDQYFHRNADNAFTCWATIRPSSDKLKISSYCIQRSVAGTAHRDPMVWLIASWRRYKL